MTEQDEKVQRLKAENQRLKAENKRMREQIDGYVSEFRVCRFCSHIHGDCSPTDGSCHPKWRGL